MAKLARMLADEDAHGHAGADVRRTPRLRTRYYAFLSYSHQDKDLADWLHRELEKFRVPHSLAGHLTETGVVPRRLTPIFRDQHDLSAADDLGEEIKAALAGSQFLVVLCSPASATSRWTNAEIESFKRTRPEGCVLAAVASGEPFASDMPGREGEECFPPALRYKYDRRGHRTTKRAEPLAADLRGRRRRPAHGVPQARCGNARSRSRRTRSARHDQAPSPDGMARRGLARWHGGYEHAGCHGDSGSRCRARPAPPGGRAHWFHAWRSQGQARADRQARRTRRRSEAAHSPTTSIRTKAVFRTPHWHNAPRR